MIYGLDFDTKSGYLTFVFCVVLIAFFIIMGILYFFSLIKTKEQYSKEFSRKLSYVFFALVPGTGLILLSLFINLRWVTLVGYGLDLIVIFYAMRLLNKKTK